MSNKKLLGGIGDVNPVTHGGGYIYQDDDSLWLEYSHGLETGVSTIKLFIVHIEDCVECDWADLDKVATSYGCEVDSLIAMGRSPNLVDRAYLLEAIGGYYGWENFDPYPVTLTEQQLTDRWGVNGGGIQDDSVEGTKEGSPSDSDHVVGG